MDIKTLIFKGGGNAWATTRLGEHALSHQQYLLLLLLPFDYLFSIPQVTLCRSLWVPASEMESRSTLSKGGPHPTSQQLVSEFGLVSGIGLFFHSLR